MTDEPKYTIAYYKDRRGKEAVKDYIDELAEKSDKNSRIKFLKIWDFLRLLSIHGQSAGLPYVKHIRGDIWELRPIRDRIFFAAWDENGFILLHHFIKKTRKTPLHEIETAERRLKDAMVRKKEQEDATEK